MVIAIIALLVALLLPAVQQARESARRASCKNNIRQIGLALHNYHDTYGCFPIGARRPHSGASAGPSWYVGLLPALEQSALYDAIDVGLANYSSAPAVANASRNASLPFLYCPSSPLPQKDSNIIFVPVPMAHFVGVSGAVASAHAAYYDANYDNQEVDSCCLPVMNGYVAANGMLVPNSVTRMRDAEDGTSNTLIVVECGDYGLSGTNKVRIDGSYRGGWFIGTANQGTPPNMSAPSGGPPPPPGITPNLGVYNLTTIRYPVGTRRATLPGINSFGSGNPNLSPFSAHAGGANVLLTDGSVKFLGENMDLHTLKLLADRKDGVPIGEY
ncbi:DUF1559 domain-containing protein [Rubinisphaera sp. ICM_H10]|nr:DUF1559 domain-containing protein [Rubinisphaera margarita]